jgi:drug/metabolite transporter (DMT)-like permease
MNIFQFLILIFYALAISIAQLFLVKSAQLLNLTSLKFFLLSVIANYWLLIGLIIYIIGFLAWIIILKYIDVRLAYPFVMLSVLFTSIFQTYIDKLTIEPIYWIGLLLISSGLIIINNAFSK